MSPFSWRRHARHDLSAHADGQLAPERAARIEQHLSSCEDCRAEFADLVALRTALSSLPEIPAQRSFALTPEQARGPARVYEPATGRTQLVNGLRLGSAGLAMALVAVVLLDTSGDNEPSSRDDAALEMESATQEYRASDGDQAETDSADTLSAPPTPSPNATLDITGAPTGETTGGGGTGGSSSSGGVGGVGVAEPSPNAEVPAADAAAGTTTAPTDAPPQATTTPEEALRAPEDEFASSGADDSDAADTKSAPESSETASEDADGDNGLLALEILLALGAAGALIASVVVARAARRDPSGN